MSKTVTSAGHDKERIGAFLMEGDAEDEQSSDDAPEEAIEPTPAPVEVDAALGSATLKGPDSNAGIPSELASLGSDAPQPEQVHQQGDKASVGAATGMMSFVNRHLPIWRSIVALRKQIQAQQGQIQAQQGQIQAQQEQIQAQQEQIQAQQGQLAMLNAFAQQLRQQERLSGNSAQDRDRMDAWYQDLQDLHRGSQESLTEVQRSYVHHFNDRAADLRLAGPIFDLGCGRGEWLALMAAEGWAVRGVDSSEVAVSEARTHGLDVELGDLVEALEACPEKSLAGVTAFQVVEHLPFSRITALMHAAFRALAPGGILLLETPNPENLQVATYGFWMDPTHRHPIPPPLIMDLSFHVGFRDGSILRKNPWPQWQETKVDSSLESEIDYRLFGPQDYALLVFKPATAD